MPYYNKCGKCGARLDPGEACRCDSASGVRMAAVSAPVVIRVEERATLAEQASEIDRKLAMAWREYRAEKEAKKRKRRKKR